MLKGSKWAINNQKNKKRLKFLAKLPIRLLIALHSANTNRRLKKMTKKNKWLNSFLRSLAHRQALGEELKRYSQFSNKSKFKPRIPVGKKWRMEYPDLYKATNPQSEWCHPGHVSISKNRRAQIERTEKRAAERAEKKNKTVRG